MSLFFNERNVEQQKKDPLKEQNTFTYPWIIEIPPANEGEIDFYGEFQTTYKYFSEEWNLHLTRNHISVYTSKKTDENHERIKIWNGTCFISYNLYSDNDMKLLMHSSPGTEMTAYLPDWDAFQTSTEFMERMVEAFDQRKTAKIVIFVELHLPSMYFCRPFDMPSCNLGREKCDAVPADVENDYRFQFLKESDFIIKCTDGLIPASRMILNLSSSYMNTMLKLRKDRNEYSVNSSIDVAKPVVIYLHTRCFEMPKVYDLDFAKRLFDAKDNFWPDHSKEIKCAIELSLCRMFVQEHHDFGSILKWARIASHNFLRFFESMIATIVADKFYLKWHETFPVNARNNENPNFLEVFGPYDFGRSQGIFNKIEKIYNSSFLTNVILN